MQYQMHNFTNFFQHIKQISPTDFHISPLAKNKPVAVARSHSKIIYGKFQNSY